MQKILALAILLILLLPAPALAATEQNAAAPDDAEQGLILQDTQPMPLTMGDLAGQLDMAEFEARLADVDALLRQEDAGVTMSEIWQGLLSGKRQFDLTEIWQTLRALLFANIRSSGSLLGQLLLLSLLAILLTLLKDNFAGGEIAQIGRWVIYLLLIGLAVLAFMPSLARATATVEMIRDLIYALLPLLIPLLAAIGGVTTAGIVSPALLFAISVMMSLMANLIFPLICFSAILRICGGLAPRLSLEKMAALFKDVALGLMGVVATVFIAFLGLTGMSTASWDGLAVKAVKTASGAFIPVVGRSIADVMDSVLGTALVLKNALGLVGAVAILFICALPAMQILLQALVFRIAGALIQPLGEEKLAEAVTGMGNSLILLFASLTVCGLFAYFTLALLVGLGNITMMMR
ncbi:MAG: stage III sporulation protein AE [Clostridia bacterium]|nr:stage III sporulation protein AE [Clostridia bacterium]